LTYLICPRCDVRTYSVELYLSVDRCPNCGSVLPRRFGDNVVPIASHPRFGRGVVSERPPGAGGRGA
jgi:hypothetical protein